MKKEAKLLLNSSINSLIESISRFNSPYNRGRVTTSLILLDHAFEMLLKASIVQKGGKIREPKRSETIGFDTCVRKAISNADCQFLNEEQALTLQTINGLRDAAQHHLVDVSEEQLYLHMQSGVTLFRDILDNVFTAELISYLPERVLPVSVKPITSIEAMFENEITEVKKLLAPGSRKKTEARSRLKPLAILDMNIQGDKRQPADTQLNKVCSELASGKAWQNVFPGIASIKLSADDGGPSINLRFVKKGGIPVEVIPEGTDGSAVVGVKRVNELDYYSLSHKDLAEKIGITQPKLSALIWKTKLQNNADYFKEFRMGNSLYKRYASKAIQFLKSELERKQIDDVWIDYKAAKNTEKTQKQRSIA
jgi:hypothetical protein